MYRVAAYSYVGLRKKTNQDSCFAEVAVTPFGDTAIIAVCDGVGGLSSGELASGSAVDWLSKWFDTSYATMLEKYHNNVEALFNRVQSEWEDGLIGLNAALRNYGRTHSSSLGTTFTAILFFRGQYVIGHVGDTRVYRFDSSGMEILTDDQTWVARELALGNISSAQARNHPKKNVILQSVGTQRELMPVFLRGEGGNAGETYMVCCDGFRNELFDDELAEVFGKLQGATEEQMYSACENLSNLAMSRNEKDNISAVVLTCTPGSNYTIPDQLTMAAYPAAPSQLIEPMEAADMTSYLGDFEDTDAPASNAGEDATTVLDDGSEPTTMLTENAESTSESADEVDTKAGD